MNPITTSIACLGLAVTCSAQTVGLWTQLKPATSPSARERHAMAYDSAQGRTVLFGGWSSNYMADTWEWDGKNWIQIKPATSPPARLGHAMAYDSARQRTVLFGGYVGSSYLSDIWEWDGKNWTNVTPAPPAKSPLGRYGHAMVYDSARKRTVSFGGYNRGYLNDTWEWSGTNWTNVTPAPPATSPSDRRDHAMAYQLARGRTVLFGGWNGSSRMGDTWEWDGKNWTQIKPASSPSNRSDHAMAYDWVRGRAVLFGGYGPGGLFADTWEWDGKNWTNVTPAPPAKSPPGRYLHAMAYDFARGRTVMFGGWTSQPKRGTSAELWEYIPASPATFTSFGSGCKGSAGTPQLTATTKPIYGKTFTTMLSGLQTAPAAGPFIAVGMSDQKWGTIKLPLDLGLLGMPGCKLFVSADVTLPLKNSAGTARFDLAIPATNPWLLGKNLYLQGLILDPKANALGVALSNAGKATIGF